MTTSVAGTAEAVTTLRIFALLNFQDGENNAIFTPAPNSNLNVDQSVLSSRRAMNGDKEVYHHNQIMGNHTFGLRFGACPAHPAFPMGGCKNNLHLLFTVCVSGKPTDPHCRSAGGNGYSTNASAGKFFDCADRLGARDYSLVRFFDHWGGNLRRKAGSALSILPGTTEGVTNAKQCSRIVGYRNVVRVLWMLIIF